MAKQTEFQKQLSDPRWQKKRLQILERDEWTCKRCGDTETTLTAHHKSYRMEGGKFVDYWDYEDQHLTTLCNLCHEEEEVKLESWKKNLYYMTREQCEDSDAIEMVSNLVFTMACDLGRRVTGQEILEMFKSSTHFNMYAKNEGGNDEITT